MAALYSSATHMSLLISLCLCGFFAVEITHAAIVPPVYDPDVIVNDLTKCPVKTVPFSKTDFDTDSLATMPDLLEKSNVTQKCKDEAVSELINCFADGDPSSLQIMTGCCSRACADAVKNSVQSGCFPQYVMAICGDLTTTGLRTGLFAAGKRCANFDASCKKPAIKAANTTATATNASTTIATVASTAASAPPTGTSNAAADVAKAAGDTTAPTSSTAKNGALGALVSTVSTCMLAAVALLAALQ